MRRRSELRPDTLRAVCAGVLIAIAPAAFAQSSAGGAAAVTPANPGLVVAPPVERVKTASGLQYEDVRVGTGPEARAGNRVTVHYTGWLKSRDGSTGRKFDSSRDHDEPFQFQLGGGQVIEGWDEGVQGMRVGGMRKLIVPSRLGYGAKGAGDSIPPNATLLFDVELLGIR